MPKRAKRAIRTIALIALGALGGWAATVLVVKLWAPSLFSSDSGEPMAELDRLRHDFGQVPSGPTLETSFQLHNAGSRRLIVRQVKNSCECLEGTVPEMVLAPGETKPLIVQLDTKRSVGPLALELRYRTSDPAHPIFTLAVLADITRP